MSAAVRAPLSVRPSAGLSWQDRARCAETDPELFFPDKGESSRPAKLICRGCEVRAECLDYALRNGERFGIWGGTSERERRGAECIAECRCPVSVQRADGSTLTLGGVS